MRHLQVPSEKADLEMRFPAISDGCGVKMKAVIEGRAVWRSRCPALKTAFKA